jgi:DNA repair protein RadD
VKEFQLRPYQYQAVDASLSYLTNQKLAGRNGIVVQPTGSGKSLVIANIVTRLPGQCVVFQPSREILQQNLAKLAHYGYRAAVLSASMNRREFGKITLATIGTAVKYAEQFAELPFVLVDECHAVNAKGGMYQEFFEAMAKARILGLTATPYRLASNSFGSELRFLTRTRPRIFSDVVYYTQIGDLFAQGFLAPLEYRDASVVSHTDLTLNSTGADYTDASIQKAFSARGFDRRLIEEVQRELFFGRKNALIFTRFVHESERLAKAIPGCAVVTAETPDRLRAEILHDFKSGRIRAVANVGIIALGFDYPELECVVLARPSVSLALYYQQVGRVLRPHPEKPKAHVIDMVGLVKQFGRVEEIELRRKASQRGELWEVCSGKRALTNVMFAHRDVVDPKARSKQSRRRFWAKKMAGGAS